MLCPVCNNEIEARSQMKECPKCKSQVHEVPCFHPEQKVCLFCADPPLRRPQERDREARVDKVLRGMKGPERQRRPTKDDHGDHDPIDNWLRISDDLIDSARGRPDGEAKKFKNCPYCGKKLDLPKQPLFCPYCNEKL